MNEAHETQGEAALASELLQVSHEAELDRFLPFLIGPALAAAKLAIPAIAKIAPVVMKTAVPLLKKVAVKALPKIKQLVSKAKDLPDLGGGDEGDEEMGYGYGFGTRNARAWGTAFNRTNPRRMQIGMSLAFVRAARRAAQRAALDLLRLTRSGRKLTGRSVRRVVFRAILGASRKHAPFLLPTMSAVAISMRQDPASTGRTLPRPRAGRIFGARHAGGGGGPRSEGSTGRTMPTPRGRVLGIPPQPGGRRVFATPGAGKRCPTCARRALEA